MCGALFLSACSLPPVIAIASYAITGVSYLASGKAPSDHVLSAFVEQDCALFRVIMGEDICREQGDPQTDDVVIASLNERNPWDIEPMSGPVDDAFDNHDGTGDYFENTDPPTNLVDAQAAKIGFGGLIIQGLAVGTELFALMQEDGALEIFVHDPAQRDAPENMRLVLKIDGYAQVSKSLDGVRMNGHYYSINDILV